MSCQRSKYLRPGPDCLVLADTFAVSVYRNGAATPSLCEPQATMYTHLCSLTADLTASLLPC
jgi:hypothetical protein